jgi:hypothetical protein
MKAKEKHREEVHKEFPSVGKYRVRLISDAQASSVNKTLDIREYVSSETFEGFTRRGIRLSERAQVESLRDVLTELLRDFLV